LPKSWHTSNGTFQTKGKGNIQLKFFQYSNSKKLKIQPDVVEYGKGTVGKPMFDLILGTQTMDEIGRLNCQLHPSNICLNLDTRH
jgi:hypothetical protein